MSENSRYESIRQKLWHESFSVASFPQRLIAVDKQGWNSDHRYLSEVVEHERPNVIVEIGVWKGGSVITMANKIKELGLDAVIIAVGTRLGSFENWLQEEWFSDLSFENGYPKLFYKFLANIIDAGVEKYVIPLPMDSINACRILENQKIFADAIHLDGCHDYEAVMPDLQNWWKVLRNDGVLIIDDYH
jgi:SAM-dependent methyltransferase